MEIGYLKISILFPDKPNMLPTCTKLPFYTGLIRRTSHKQYTDYPLIYQNLLTYIFWEGERGVVSSTDGVSSRHDAASSLEWGDDARLGDGDTLLLHSLVNTGTIWIIHLCKWQRIIPLDGWQSELIKVDWPMVTLIWILATIQLGKLYDYMLSVNTFCNMKVNNAF